MNDETKSLAARARAGDQAALNALLERHLETVYRFVSVKLGAAHPALDDIVQETLIGASRSIRGSRGETNAQIAGWLLSIARHKVADHLRAQYSRPHDSLEGTAGSQLADPQRPVDEQVMARQRAEQLRIAFANARIDQARAVLREGDRANARGLLHDSRDYLDQTKKDLSNLPAGDQGQIQNELNQAVTNEQQAEKQLNQEGVQGS
jgi:RNA polymerase sigma factor (sigma-70 family)